MVRHRPGTDGNAELGKPGGDPEDTLAGGHAERDVDNVLADAGAGRADDPVRS